MGTQQLSTKHLELWMLRLRERDTAAREALINYSCDRLVIGDPERGQFGGGGWGGSAAAGGGGKWPCHVVAAALEEAWIVHALVRGDGLSQPAGAELLGRHKSWVCRRLALLEKLAPEAREDLGLRLISPTVARQLTRLPAGSVGGQAGAYAAD